MCQRCHPPRATMFSCQFWMRDHLPLFTSLEICPSRKASSLASGSASLTTWPQVHNDKVQQRRPWRGKHDGCWGLKMPTTMNTTHRSAARDACQYALFFSFVMCRCFIGSLVCCQNVVGMPKFWQTNFLLLLDLVPKFANISHLFYQNIGKFLIQLLTYQKLSILKFWHAHCPKWLICLRVFIQISFSSVLCLCECIILFIFVLCFFWTSGYEIIYWWRRREQPASQINK